MNKCRIQIDQGGTQKKKKRVVSFCVQFDAALYGRLKKDSQEKGIPAARLLRTAFEHYLLERLAFKTSI
jgi:hypothetical protein